MDFYFSIKKMSPQAQTNSKRDECRKFHRSLTEDLTIRTIAEYGTLIEVDVGLDNKWTDYYGVAINDIVHASKDMGAGFRWIKEQ